MSATHVSATALGTYHHLVGTYDGDVVSLYVDGILRDTLEDQRVMGAAFVENAKVNVGSLASLQFFKGLIDEVAVYEHSLTGTAVLEHFQARTAK